ncbi:signal-induced proliferation-associated 1-like protein 2 isoform X2 [Babylonia areolata]|uniref:signal-induced proliferation-associated 1-like protein 2 isoform X2 n=1 Tax=Babylonia areolata TaxID=304850 RepID=UPI003FD2C884
MSHPPNELETIRQRARQAVEYYKRQVNSASADSGGQGGNVRSNASASPFSSAYHRSMDKEGAQEQCNRVGGQLQGQRSSMEDILHGGVAPASSNSFYRAKMKAGIIDMRSSYNERIGSGSSRQRSRTFHGPHTGRTRTQTYAVDPYKAKPSASITGKPKESPAPSQRPNVGSPPSPSPPQRYTNHQAAMSSTARVGGSRRNSRGLYRSNSNLEMDSMECIEDDLPPAALHREYGSTSSLDLLASAGQENYADMLKDFKNGHSPPREPRLRQLLQQQQQQKVMNGVMEKEEDEGSDHGKSKNKSKGKERKTRAKSITGDSSSASILKKLRGTSSKHDAGDGPAKSDDKCNEESASEERLRQKAFIHFDCQSVGVRLSKSSKSHSLPNYMKNITTGASAASVKRNSYAVSDKDLAEGTEDDDVGDGKNNDLVLSCPFFRNELGGEGSVLTGVAPLAAYKHSTTSNTSAMSPCPCVRHPACCGVAILDSSPSPSGKILPPLVKHRGYVIEYVDHGAYYYRHYFHSFDHQNLFGTDDQLGPVAVSVRREKVDPEERTNNLGRADYGLYQYRIICRTSQLTTLRGSILEDAIPSSGRLSSSRGVPLKEVLEVAIGEVNLSCLKQATPGPKTADQLLKLDEQGICTNYKVGIMYCRAGQSSEEEMYNNECGSPVFDEFLNLIGQKVRLKGFDKYRGGLDCKTDTTGLHSYYTTFNNNEIMFHISTILPFTPNNHQQLLRKRHIGNDIVTIVFQEPGALPFSPRTVRSQFQHVFIIVRVSNPNTENTRYSIAVSRSKDVPPFGPPIPDMGSFPKSAEFVDFLMAKIINAENAAHRSEKFRTMAQRTRQEYLKDLATNFCTNNALDSGSKLSKFALGSGRKKEKTKHRVVPYMYTKGALVWNVQVEDMGSSVQVESLLAIAADTIVLLDSASTDVIFTVPCSTVIGWTLQASSIRLYFGQGECILLRPLSGDMEEMTEIITRLTAVSQGTETMKLVLKRNGLGQLGFHIQSEGIVTDVEPYGFAWEVGLRKGSRLVEICKVATITLTHDQIVDLLRTSAVVKVVVVPPLEDGTPRGDGRPSMSSSRSSISTPTSTPHVCMATTTPTTSTMAMATSSATSAVSGSYYEQSGGRQSNSTVPTSHGYSDSTLSSGRGSDDGRGSSFYSHSRQESELYGSSHDGQLSSGDELHSRSASHDSSDYSLSSNSRRGLSSSGRQAQAALRRGEASNYLNMEASASNTYLPGTDSVYSSVSQHSNFPGPRRQFATMDYTSSSMPATGNIALELLKQTQNTKYLLGQEAPPNAHPAPPPAHTPTSAGPGLAQGGDGGATNFAGVSSSSSLLSLQSSGGGKQDMPPPVHRDDTFPRRKESSQLRKAYSSKKHLETSPMSSNNSSPRSSSKNLSGMSSEESLNTRHRSAVSSQQRGAGGTTGASRINFQEELKRLIDPDISESDLASLSSKPPPNRRSRRLQRTYSDESLHSTKGSVGAPSNDVVPSNDLSIGTDLIFTTAVPKAAESSPGSDNTASERLSPRAVADVGRPRGRKLPDGRTLPDAMSLDWTDLVHVATKAIESDSRTPPPPPLPQHSSPHREDSEDEAPPPPRPPSPKDNISLSSAAGLSTASWLSLSSSPEQRVKELERLVQQLQADLDKERRRTSKQEAEIQDLRAENVRLQEESQTAAAQLRRFTEWFFNTIDRQ